MKAKIVSCEKAIHPRYSNVTNQDELTVMVLTKVEFYTDDGQLFHTQEYAHLPEDADPAYFQKQADAMQADIDHVKANAHVAQASQLADQKVEQINSFITK